jgi:hypothetical protein
LASIEELAQVAGRLVSRQLNEERETCDYLAEGNNFDGKFEKVTYLR